MSLVARELEANGIPTVVVGSARDIVEECGVPRFLFTDFPLGNPCGKPNDPSMQLELVGYALDLLEVARWPRTTVQTPFIWSENDAWKGGYARVEADQGDRLKRAGEARRRSQKRAHEAGRARSS